MSLQKPQLCLITNRKLLTTTVQIKNLENNPSDPALELLFQFCIKASQAGIDIIQIREKDLSTKDLAYFVSSLTKITGHTKILVNDRLDVALSCGASGIHLPSNSFSVKEVRKFVGTNFIISKSTHNISEASLAAKEGADFILFSPIFDTPSKRSYGKPLGLDILQEAVTKVSCPIIALGGINKENYKSVLKCGAVGLAAIRLFTESLNLVELVNELKQ